MPPGQRGSFDHGDVDPRTGRVFVAHTDFGTIDVIDPDRLEVVRSIDGCPEGSGVVLSTDESRLAFAASRGSGKVLVLDADQLGVVREITVGPKPNGLAWDHSRGQLLVADVDANDRAARLASASTGDVTSNTRLPGRPRWCVFDAAGDRYLLNIRDPACVITLTPSGEISASWPISSSGPHGLDLDRERGLAFVACDGGQVIVVDIADGGEVAAIPISGEPDAIWFNPSRQHLYVAVGNPGVIDIVDTLGNRLADSVRTEPGAHTTAFDAERQRLYVFLPQSGESAVFEAD